MNSIIIVEDSPVDSALLRSHLKYFFNNNVEIFEETDVSKIKELLSQKKDSIVFLDIFLGQGLNGLDILRHIKSIKQSSPRVIVTSAFEGVVDRIKIIENGADDFLVKPIKYEDFQLRMIVQTRIKKMIEDTQWANEKTNACIKILYKGLEQKNEQLKSLDHLKDEFIGNISHEIRTPLTVIREITRQVLDRLHGDLTANQDKYLNISLTNVDQLTIILDNILDISKLEEKKYEISKERINLKTFLDKLSDQFELQARSKGLSFECFYPPLNIEIFADRFKLVQVFTNLFNNALKFTEHGKISIQVVLKDKDVEFSIRDTGRGINSEDLPKMFGKFIQVGRTFGPGQKGTGLGLAICKGIIELHQGKIWVSSHLNQGTTFYFTLPRLTGEQLLLEQFRIAVKQANLYNKPFSIVVVNSAVFFSNNIIDPEGYITKKLYRKNDIVLSLKDKVFILLPETSKDNAKIVVERLHQSLFVEAAMQKLEEKVDLSIVIYEFPIDIKSENDFESLIIREGK